MQKITFSRGYSLLEVLLTISIVSISLSICSPTFVSCYRHMKILALTHQISQEIYLARSEAIKRQQKIIYSVKHFSVQGNGGWDKERIIIDESHHVLHQFSELPSGYHVTFHNSLGINDKIVFLPLGFTQGQTGSFYLVASDRTVRIIVELSGRIRVE